MKDLKGFTIRVYGILMNHKQEVLLVHEKMPTMHFTKFPGGGLEYGEGTRDCLIREFMEETGLEVEIAEHLYTTDYYQVSKFNPNQQLLAIYYRVKSLQPLDNLNLDEMELNVGGKTEVLRFYWYPLETGLIQELTFPVDKLVAEQLLKRLDELNSSMI